MAYIQTANRTIERSPNVAAIGADYLYASVRGLLTLKRQKYGLYTDGESYHRTVASCGCDRC